MRKEYKAFTLVEMLIVMGIIIILMAVGIASGRFAIRRANKIEHQNAAEQLYQALQSYYTDNREYPGTETVDALVTGIGLGEADNSIADYIDDFDGGSDASYSYTVDGTGQETIVCVTYGGLGDENALGIYCTGNGIAGTIANAPSVKDIEVDLTSPSEYLDAAALINANCSAWTAADEWTSDACNVNIP
jgi:type II secretory pathway pseudopilin PulG